MVMEFWYGTEICVPVNQLVLLLICSTVALLFGKLKLALLVNYLFTLFWGYFVNKELLIGSGNEASSLVLIYVLFGLAVVFLAVVGFLIHRHQ